MIRRDVNIRVNDLIAVLLRGSSANDSFHNLIENGPV